MNTYKDFLKNKGEQKWQDTWEEQKLFKTSADAISENKFYILPQLPYPSGSGLHVGHAEVYTACDIYARYQRMKGKKVLQVIGWDSFGLPAENYAIKTNVHPRKSTQDAVNNFRSQIKSLGISVDWDREVGSHNPDYYKWTQWFFLLFYKRGLAYRKKQSVNWCDSCKTVLANDQVKEGHCERCDTLVVQREMEQWYIKITDYAERLLNDIDKLDWPEETKKRQKDWIGKSEGATIHFSVIPSPGQEHVTPAKAGVQGDGFPNKSGMTIEVFTTRPDTLFGATYMVLAPEGKYVQQLKDNITNWKEVEKYIEATSKKTELDRQVQKEKTGVELKGVKAINPVNNEEIPIFVADYVLASYGTGAIMAVPAHDERDFEFAKKYGLEIRDVVAQQVGERKDDSVRRNSVRAILMRDDGKILLTYDKKMDEYIFPGGGIEPEENIKAALIREIVEETGYTDIGIGKYLGTIEHNFFHTFRKVDRTGLVSAYAVKLLSDKVVSRAKDEVAKTDFFWMSIEDVREKMNNNAQSFGKEIVFLNRFSEFEGIYSDPGVAINSDFLNGLETKEAKEKMIAWLEKNDVGKRKVQYKLRDWSVSRQRFWGAPIPMLFNEDRKNTKFDYVFVHGYYDGVDFAWLLWLKKKLETMGHTVTALNLPNVKEPNIDEQVNFLLNNVTLSKNSVLVGHSLGGAVIMKLLEKAKQKVAKVVFVDCFIHPEFTDKRRELIEKSCDWNFDYKLIKNLSDEFVVLSDSEETVIERSQHEEMQKLLDARLVITKPLLGHFRGIEEPTVLEESLVAGLKPVPELDLPVLLPDDVDFKPTGQSPLTYSKEFQKGVEKKYGKGWQREPDTLDTFMCSSWYYYRYLDPHNDKEFASPENLKKWMPVDFYLGGPEHVNGHLLYSRFFTKVLYDAGYIDFDEPFKVHRHQGLILGEDNRKMSKRWGNVINPTDVMNEFGADILRMYEMFMGPLEEDKPWDTNGVKGVRRFLERVWMLQEKVIEAEAQNSELTKLVHKTIKKIGQDLDNLSFNTAIARLMEFVNVLVKEEKISKAGYKVLIQLLAPFAPHLSDELWARLGNKGSVSQHLWPIYEESQTVDDEITLAVQVNGKLRDTIMVSADISEEDARLAALKSDNVVKWLEGKKPKKVIYVKGKLISIVV